MTATDIVPPGSATGSGRRVDVDLLVVGAGPAGLYAAYLRDYALARGATRIEGTIEHVDQHPETGFVTGVRLQDGRTVEGDLFVDCSGFRALLIAAGYADANDCDALRADPAFKMAVGRLP